MSTEKTWNFFEEAKNLANTIKLQGFSQTYAAKRLGFTQSALSNKLRLLRLSPVLQEKILASNLTERHARALLRLSDPQRQLELARECAQQHLSVKQLEARIERMGRDAPRKPQVSRIIRDNRIIINAVLDTVKERNRIGVHVESRVEERADGVEVIVRIPSAHTEQKAGT